MTALQFNSNAQPSRFNRREHVAEYHEKAYGGHHAGYYTLQFEPMTFMQRMRLKFENWCEDNPRLSKELDRLLKGSLIGLGVGIIALAGIDDYQHNNPEYKWDHTTFNKVKTVKPEAVTVKSNQVHFSDTQPTVKQTKKKFGTKKVTILPTQKDSLSHAVQEITAPVDTVDSTTIQCVPVSSDTTQQNELSSTKTPAQKVTHFKTNMPNNASSTGGSNFRYTYTAS